jgi:hypothetical protein
MYYIKYLDIFRAILCSSSGGQNCISTASGIVTLCERPCSASLTDTSQNVVAPQNKEIFINTAGNIFNLAICIAFTAVSTRMACHLPRPSATWQQFHRTSLPENIGFFQLTQRYLVQDCVFFLNNMPFCLVRYYTSCNFKYNSTP